MIPACFQTLYVTTKGDVTGKEVGLKLGLKQGSPLSPVLLLVYINDIHRLWKRRTESEMLINQIGNADITFTADDVFIHKD